MCHPSTRVLLTLLLVAVLGTGLPRAARASSECDDLTAVLASCRAVANDATAAAAILAGSPGSLPDTLAALRSAATDADARLATASGPTDFRRRRQALRFVMRGAGRDAQRILARRREPQVALAMARRLSAAVMRVARFIEGSVARDGCTSAPPVELGGSLVGRQVFPSDNWWNRDVSTARVVADSDAIIDFIGRSKGLHPDFGTDFGIPYVVVGGTQAKLPVRFDYDDESDPGAPGLPPGYPIPEEARSQAGFIEGGVPGGGTDGDRHLLLVDRDHWLLFELYAVRWTGTAWTAGSGAIFDLASNARRPETWTSADAAGLAMLPGLVRADEVFAAGQINHALRFTVRGTRGYVFPASHDATSGPGGNSRPPLGLRVRLKASKDLSSFAPPAQVILRAMQRYGMIVADNGSDWFVSGAPDPRWDDELMHDQFALIKGGDFEVVE
jgi:hypothetical protein